MKNKEKFMDKIADIACNGGSIAVNNITYEPVDCNSINCDTCLFHDCGGYCCDALIEWARREYKKPIVISYTDSEFLKFISGELKYIARDGNGRLYGYINMPKKYAGYSIWISTEKIDLNKFNIDFPMIKWADEQPWKISYLKELKVVKNY